MQAKKEIFSTRLQKKIDRQGWQLAGPGMCLIFEGKSRADGYCYVKYVFEGGVPPCGRRHFALMS